jgi:hypothetical protein
MVHEHREPMQTITAYCPYSDAVMTANHSDSTSFKVSFALDRVPTTSDRGRTDDAARTKAKALRWRVPTAGDPTPP